MQKHILGLKKKHQLNELTQKFMAVMGNQEWFWG